MDFVVVGFGLGALIVLLGLAVRVWGPRQWPVHAEEPLGAAGLARAVARGRTCRAGGAVVAGGGIVLVVATLLAVVGQAGDEAGDLIVLTAGLVALGLVALWAIAFANQRWVKPFLERLGRASAQHWAALKQNRARTQARRRAAPRRQRRPVARARPAPRPRPAVREQPAPKEPEPDVERGWLPPLPLDDDYDWHAPAPDIAGASEDGRSEDVPHRRVVGR